MSKKSIRAAESHQSASESSDTWKPDDEWWAEWRVRLSAWPETNRPYRPQLGKKWVAPSLKDGRKAWTKEAISLAKQRHSHHAPIRDFLSWFDTNYPRFAELLALFPHLQEQVSLTDAEKTFLITQELAEHGAAISKDNSSWKVRDAVDLCIRFALRSSEAIALVKRVAAAVNRTVLLGRAATGKHKSASTGEQGNGTGDETERWLTVTEAATHSGISAGVISRAADSGELKSNGTKKRERRIDAVDLARWGLKRAMKSKPTESDERVKQLSKQHVHNYRD